MMMQMMKLEGLLWEEKLSASVARDMRIPGVDDLMRLQARVVIESYDESQLKLAHIDYDE